MKTFWRAWYATLDALCRVGIHRWEVTLFVPLDGCPEIPGKACERCDAERMEWTHAHGSEGRES